MNKKLSAAEVLKEAAILTAAVAIIAAALYLRHLIHACRAIDSYDGAEEILHFLREKFEEVEE